MAFEIEFLELLYYTLVAYFTNGSCTLAELVKKRHPLDFNKNLGKNRILGDGKTFEGVAIGLSVGALSSYIISLLVPTFIFTAGFMVSSFTVIGDIVSSFVKRRLGKPRGSLWFPVDQYDFIVSSYIILSFYIKINFWAMLIFLVLTYFIHRGANLLAYRLKLKKVPW